MATVTEALPMYLYGRAKTSTGSPASGILVNSNDSTATNPGIPTSVSSYLSTTGIYGAPPEIYNGNFISSGLRVRTFLLPDMSTSSEATTDPSHHYFRIACNPDTATFGSEFGDLTSCAVSPAVINITLENLTNPTSTITCFPGGSSQEGGCYAGLMGTHLNTINSIQPTWETQGYNECGSGNPADFLNSSIIPATIIKDFKVAQTTTTQYFKYTITLNTSTITTNFPNSGGIYNFIQYLTLPATNVSFNILAIGDNGVCYTNSGNGQGYGCCMGNSGGPRGRALLEFQKFMSTHIHSDSSKTAGTYQLINDGNDPQAYDFILDDTEQTGMGTGAIHLMLHMGDITYNMTYASKYMAYLDMYEPLHSRVPSIYTMGNHEFEGDNCAGGAGNYGLDIISPWLFMFPQFPRYNDSLILTTFTNCTAIWTPEEPSTLTLVTDDPPRRTIWFYRFLYFY